MSLKSRRLRLGALCLLFALLAGGGFGLWIAARDADAAWHGLSTTQTPVDTTMPGREETEPAPEETTQTQAGMAIPQVVEPQPANRVPLLRILAIACFAAAAALGLLSFRWQRWVRPALGPEGESLLLLMLAGLWGGLYERAAEDLILRGLLTLALLPVPTLVGGLWFWLRRKAPLSWCGVHRLAVVLGGRNHPYRVYGPVLVLFICAAPAGAVAVVLSQLPQLLPLGLWCLMVGVLSLACLIGYGIQSDRLQGQIRALHEGRDIAVGGGLFREDEERLHQLRRQRDEAVQTAVTGERFKVELIANVSHDLRTPLTAILGYGELLEQEQLSPEGGERLARLNQKAGYMRSLVEELFELTKVSSGALEAHMEQLDLVRLLEQTLGLMDDRLAESSLVVRRRYHADALLLVTDGGRMHHVFANLVENAIKYALPGTRIYLETRDAEHGIEVRITNTASYEMDFAPEEIVQRFSRGDRARTTQGSGLGLAIAQTYTQSVGGDFRVEIDGDQFRAIVTLPRLKES